MKTNGGGPLRVGFDLTALLPEPTGVDQYCLEMAKHLPQVDERSDYVLFLNAEDRGRLDGIIPERVEKRFVCLRPRLARLVFQQILLPLYAQTRNLDVIHSPAFVIPFLRGRAKHVLAVHDMTFFSQPRCHTRLRRSTLYRRGVISSIRRAHAVHVPSTWVQKEVLRLVPGVPAAKIQVVPYGIRTLFRPREETEVRQVLDRYELKLPYILSVCTLEPRKNLVRLVRCYRELVQERAMQEHLVLVGRSGWGIEELRRELETPSQKGQVHLLGYVPDQDLPYLYNGARVFVYPSIEEGFGFPPLEAMASGTPTVASDNSSLAENLRGAAELVPPEDSQALKSALYVLCTDPARRERLIQKGLSRAAGFSWSKAATRTVESYLALCQSASL